MTRFTAALFTAVVLTAPLLSAVAAPIVGEINFTGSDTYNTTTNVVDFINPQTVTSDNIGFTPCVGCGTVAGATAGVFDYSSAFPAPPAKPLVYNDLLHATANGRTFSFDLQTISVINEQANVSLAIEGTGILHLSGSDDTPGSFFFSTQGPESPVEVSFSATNVAAPVSEPRVTAIFALAIMALGWLNWRQRERLRGASEE
jgi:hypothetical protein